MNEYLSRLEDGVMYVAVAFVTTAGGAAVWLMRRIFTNQQEIADLRAALDAQLSIWRAEMASREELRKRDREDMHSISERVDSLHDMFYGYITHQRHHPSGADDKEHS